MEPLILASGSPRRRDLLAMLGWPFIVQIPDVDETPLIHEAPGDLVARLALKKALSVTSTGSKTFIVAADTVVVLDGQVLGKPADMLQAENMLERLSGRAHEVLSGIALCRGGRSYVCVERTTVRFRPLSKSEVLAYCATGEGMDKAGAYAVQGRGALMIQEILGDYYNVVGLPLGRLSAMLDAEGISLSRQWAVM
ncbi:MAG: septum formation inhibitor Maf [Dethiosulfovibrio peptidovorans]|nr:MAG: septum formation inhibitor Maf [Dethiosulfovibrio peptidovorans]